MVVGAIAKAFGLHGEVFVHPDPDLAEPFNPGRRYRAVPPGPGGETRTLTVAASRLHGGRQLVRFKGVADRAGAEALRGVVLTVPREEFELDEDEFWTADLLGAEVVADDGTTIGVLEGTLDGSAHDYLVVARPDGGELLIPAVEDLVDVTPGRIVVHPIPGLVDAGEEGGG